MIEAANVRLHLLSAMVHGIETAGALLDPHPFKAKGQGKKRFQLALNKLFPKVYTQAGTKLHLYNILRSHISHCMLPARQVVLTDSKVRHLNQSENELQFHLPSFYTDYEAAIEKLIQLIESGQVKTKRIVFDNLEHL